jgi:hypothetical protein
LVGIRRGGFGGGLDCAVDGVCAGDTCGGGESGKESTVGMSKRGGPWSIEVMLEGTGSRASVEKGCSAILEFAKCEFLNGLQSWRKI